MSMTKIIPFECQQYESLLNEYWSASKSLNAAVFLVAIRRDVISLYPDGADRISAENDLADAQHHLLCAIGAVDGRLADMNQYYEAHCDILQKNHYKVPNYYTKSHELVEQAYFAYRQGESNR